jgi:hypothetical protein
MPPKATKFGLYPTPKTATFLLLLVVLSLGVVIGHFLL